MNPMKKKTVRILFCVLLVAVLVSAFSMTALPQAMWRVRSKTHGTLQKAKFRQSSTMLFFPCAI